MSNDHWFDTLNKLLVRDAPRRTLLRAAAAVAASLALGAAPVTEAKRNTKKRKGKKDKPKPNPAPSCSGGDCAAEPEWTGNQNEIDFCELVCRQCDGADPRQFCIVDGVKPDGTPTKVARCCDVDQKCCGTDCCGPAGQCCDLRDRGKVCISPNATCCPSDTVRGFCSPGQVCCPDVGCVQCPNFAEPRDLQCCGSTCHNALFSVCCLPDQPCAKPEYQPDLVCCPAPVGCCLRGKEGCCEE